MCGEGTLSPVKLNQVEAASSRSLPIKVAILTGGGDRPYALGLANALIARSISFDFIGSDDLRSDELEGSPLVRFLNLRGDQTPSAPMTAKVARTCVYYVKLIVYAARSRAAVFHLLWNNKFETFDRTFLTLYYKLLGKRIVLTAHNVNIRTRDGNDSWLNRLTLGIQYRLIDHVFVHTEAMKRELQADFRLPAEKVSVIPFGINSTVPNTALTAAEARRKLALEETEKTVLFFGHITPYKGLEYLIEALAHLAKPGHNYRFIVAGRPKGAEPYWESIRQRIASAGLAESVLQRIEFISDEDTELFFKAADVLALPYTHVFQSGVLFLAYNFGLPVIATDVGSLRDDILEDRTGYVTVPRDSAAFAAAISRFFASDMYLRPEVTRQFIQAYANERHSWATVAKITHDVYQKIVDVAEERHVSDPKASATARIR
jgi:glycosyltransferase involved in cell wall biosynthesis